MRQATLLLGISSVTFTVQRWTSLNRYLNASPSLSVLPSMSSDHHPRTLLMAAKAASGGWSTVKTVVKLAPFIVLSCFRGLGLGRSLGCSVEQMKFNHMV